MAVTVETLEKLERKITLNLSSEKVQDEVQKRLKKLAPTIKMGGFRPGKVPVSVVAQRNGESVYYEALGEKALEAFTDAAKEAGVRVFGQPRFIEKEKVQASEGQLAVDAVFEVFPEVVVGDLSVIEVDKYSCEITPEAIDRTIEVLRKQRCTFTPQVQAEAAQEGDRVTVDFEGKIEGESFQGSRAEGFQVLLGEGQILKEFDAALRGMKQGESKTFPLSFPENYSGKEIAGKTADFFVTIKKIETVQLPVVDDEFAQSLGIADATVEGLRADVKRNLEREVKYRLMDRNRKAVHDVLLTKAEFEVPQAAIKAEISHLQESARNELAGRGFKNAAGLTFPDDVLRPRAEIRARAGLIFERTVSFAIQWG